VFAQLTHLRPRPGQLGQVLALLREWGEATRQHPDRPRYAFLCQDDDHLFVVSLHDDDARYRAAAGADAAWLARLMPLLVEGHGPTYCGPVLAQDGSAHGADGPFPAALKIGER
jgi:hypothetical protein